jgi:dTDP-4-amino-4,6-dideoxygalactose transaminase
MKVRLSKCSISEAEVSSVSQVLLDEYLGMGQVVETFEKNIKEYLGTDLEVVCVNSGTSALQLAVSSLDIGVGDEVLVPSLTYVATFQAISATGATPVSCEVNSKTLFICPDDVRKKITSKTKAVMPVHHSSSAEGRNEIYQLAKLHGLRVIEDAAQAFGSYHDGLKVGVNGDVLCFSFDGIKNITSAEGGAVLTQDAALVERLKDCRLLGVEKDTEKRFSGQRSWDFDVLHQGFRFHMSNVNAAIGIEQLKRIESFKASRQGIAKKYLIGLKSLRQVSFFELDYDAIMPHIFAVKAERRDELREFLISKGIECGIHYKPNHLLTMYASEGVFPVTDLLYKSMLTIPCHVDLSEEEQLYVIKQIWAFYET